jgi:predicted PurR-regulated permease PerM
MKKSTWFYIFSIVIFLGGLGVLWQRDHWFVAILWGSIGSIILYFTSALVQNKNIDTSKSVLGLSVLVIVLSGFVGSNAITGDAQDLAEKQAKAIEEANKPKAEMGDRQYKQLLRHQFARASYKDCLDQGYSRSTCGKVQDSME